jgi:hypothetical protein
MTRDLPQERDWRGVATRLVPVAALAAACLAALSQTALAHGVTVGDQGCISEIYGVTILPFICLGAKHMVTGHDHLLFLFGVIFFLYGNRQIASYVSLCAIGHATTMLIGVDFGIGINGYIIDAIIGFSVVYKALDNLGAFRLWFGVQPNTTLRFHARLRPRFEDPRIQHGRSGLVPNLLAFNVGVEIGQLIALTAIRLFMTQWRARPSFARHAYAANVAMIAAGFVLMGYQLTGLMMA